MPELVSIENARIHLRIDGNDDDEWLNVWIPVVSEAVISWLKEVDRIYLRDENGQFALDQNGQRMLRPIVCAAALVELAHQYTYREGRAENRPTNTYGHSLCAGAVALLESVRKPTLK